MTFSLRSLFLVPFFVLLALTMTACDSGGSNGSSGDDSSGAPSSSDAFTLTIEDDQGNTIRTIQAYSFFSTLTANGATSYNQSFTDQRSQDLSNSRSLIGTAYRLAERPAVGTYRASSDNEPYQRGETFLISFTVTEGSGGFTYYLVQSGDVEITRSESDRVEGTLSLQAEATTVAADGTTQSKKTVTVTGSFQAPSTGAFNSATASVSR
jgi:hypothetical protein